MKRLLFFLVFAFSFIDLYSQDSTRIAFEINRAEAVRNSNPDSTFIYAENVLKWASRNQNNYQIGRGNAHTTKREEFSTNIRWPISTSVSFMSREVISKKLCNTRWKLTSFSPNQEI